MLHELSVGMTYKWNQNLCDHNLWFYLSDMVWRKEIPVTLNLRIYIGMESSSGHPHELLWAESETSRYFNFIRWLLIKWPDHRHLIPSSMWY